MQNILRRMCLWLAVLVLAGCSRAVVTEMPLAPTPTNLPPVADTPGAAQATPTSVVPALQATVRAAAGLTVSITTTATLTPTLAPVPAGGYRLVGYLPSSVYSRKFSIAAIPAAHLTHIIYAFAAISNAGECAAADAKAEAAVFPALRALKQQNPKLKTLISIGGYSRSAKFSDVAATVTTRRKFAQSCVKFMQQNGFDGIDIDWEFPVRGGLPGNVHRPEDKQNFSMLLEELRNQLDVLDANGGDSLLSAAVPAGPNEYANIEMAAIAQQVDWLNVMAYDFYTGGSKTTGFAAPLYASASDPSKDETMRTRYNADAAVKAYLAAGVPPNKLVFGVPFYGRGWRGVRDLGKGLFQPNQGPAEGTWAQDGAFDYADLAQNFIGRYTRYWDDKAVAPWLYNAKTGVMIAYDDPQSLGLKVDYVRVHMLGGMMVWQLSADDAKYTLLQTLIKKLGL